MKSLPKWIEKFIDNIAPSELSETILGDLEEQYSEYQNIYSHRKAKWKIFWDSLLFFRPGILLRNKLKSVNQTTMFNNHIKIGLRNIARQKLYSTINAVGLGIAIAFCALIFLFIQDEKSFDQWHSNKERIFRINGIDYEEMWSSEPLQMHAYIQSPVAIALQNEAPEVEYVTRFSMGGTAILRKDNKVFPEEISFVDPDFFKMFDFRIIHGNPDKLLEKENEIVISESTSAKYFKDENPVGMDIEIDFFGDKKSFIVAGVIEDEPANSSLDYRSVILRQEVQPFYEQNIEQWRSWNTPTFVQLYEPAQKDKLIISLKEIDLKYYYPTQSEIDEETYRSKYRPIYNLTALSDLHLDNRVSFSKVSDPLYGWILSGIALLILSIACINYVTLSITRSARKRLEVGIRKTVGSSRKEIINQFMIESILLSFLSMLIAFALIVLFLPLFNEFSGKSIDLMNSGTTLSIFIVVFSVLIGIVAGIYPSFYLSGFKPLAMLKNHGLSRFNSSWTKPLVGFQFFISACLIISSVVMYRQMNFITQKDLGYKGDQVLVIPTFTGYNDEGEKILERFKQASRGNPKILSVTGTSTSFSRGWNRNGFTIEDEYHYAYVYRIDHDYLNTLGMTLLNGRNFDPDRPTDKQRSVIVNEALVKDMGWEDPLNERLFWRDSIGHQVIGVVKDYHFLSLTQTIEPLILGTGDNTGKIFNILVKLDGNDLQSGVTATREIWKEIDSSKPFDFSFLDDDIDNQYASFSKWSNIMGITSVFAILVACLGLFGLAGINTLNRTREIGIRKVMGAEINQILFMMNKPYLIISILSFILAAPVSWFIMKKWLSSFQYTIDLQGIHFLYAFIAIGVVTLITVSYHSVKASLINPAETLKSE